MGNRKINFTISQAVTVLWINEFYRQPKVRNENTERGEWEPCGMEGNFLRARGLFYFTNVKIRMG